MSKIGHAYLNSPGLLKSASVSLVRKDQRCSVSHLSEISQWGMDPHVLWTKGEKESPLLVLFRSPEDWKIAGLHQRIPSILGGPRPEKYPHRLCHLLAASSARGLTCAVTPNNAQPCHRGPCAWGPNSSFCRPWVYNEIEGCTHILPFLPLSICLFKNKPFPFFKCLVLRMPCCVRVQHRVD